MPWLSVMPLFAMPSVKSKTALFALGWPPHDCLRTSIPMSSPPDKLVLPPVRRSPTVLRAVFFPAASMGITGSRSSTELSKVTSAKRSSFCRPCETRKVSASFIAVIFDPDMEPDRSTTATISSGWRCVGVTSGALRDTSASSVCSPAAESFVFSAHTESLSCCSVAAGAPVGVWDPESVGRAECSLRRAAIADGLWEGGGRRV
mmetsp:Transcript_15505/g.37223  ORF Transcript_15505/g.37223 Transcript_15505/m.37223 type:complete len:204 (-) Transcript_15505:26-637(-)